MSATITQLTQAVQETVAQARERHSRDGHTADFMDCPNEQCRAAAAEIRRQEATEAMARGLKWLCFQKRAPFGRG